MNQATRPDATVGSSPHRRTHAGRAADRAAGTGSGRRSCGVRPIGTSGFFEQLLVQPPRVFQGEGSDAAQMALQGALQNVQLAGLSRCQRAFNLLVHEVASPSIEGIGPFPLFCGSARRRHQGHDPGERMAVERQHRSATMDWQGSKEAFHGFVLGIEIDRVHEGLSMYSWMSTPSLRRRKAPTR